MILTAHQPTYLPWLGLFHKIALSDKYVLFDQVQYVPKDWISRNDIKTPNGPLTLTVPVLTTGHRDKTIAQIEIHNELPWARKHWKSIQANYRQAPYFKQYADFFEQTYSRPWTLLADLDLCMLEWFLKALGIKTEVVRAGAYEFKGAKSELVIDMCVQLKAKVYIFGTLGKDYADVEAFKRAGVVPIFQDYRHPVYRQLHGGFRPYMSVIDLLFNEGPRSLEILMSGNLDRAALEAAA
ncbi:MAG: WbqC family protein [Elusimicrobia bacterium]|nr:WbqC family protein [Elusimicrobiota bacterium]